MKLPAHILPFELPQREAKSLSKRTVAEGCSDVEV